MVGVGVNLSPFPRMFFSAGERSLEDRLIILISIVSLIGLGVELVILLGMDLGVCVKNGPDEGVCVRDCPGFGVENIVLVIVETCSC